MRIIETIKALLNKTIENGCTEEEAKAAFAHARKLMIKHKISEKDIKEPIEENVIKLELHYDCNVSWIYNLLKVFLDNFAAMHFMINRGNELHCCLFGTSVDVRCVETLMKCAYEYITDASEKYLNEYVEIFGVRDENVKSSFRVGFIRGLSDKYVEQNKILNKEEALMVMPNERIQNEFKEYTKDFKEEKFEYSMHSEKNDMDFLAVHAGYNEGRRFGSTALK